MTPPSPDPEPVAAEPLTAEEQSLVNMAMGDRLAAALWAEFGYADPSETGHRPRLLAPDDPYWTAAANRLRGRIPDLDAARSAPPITATAREALGRFRGFPDEAAPDHWTSDPLGAYVRWNDLAARIEPHIHEFELYGDHGPDDYGDPLMMWCPGCGRDRRDLLAALPVREDGPTGIDDWTRLAEAWANVMDGRRIGHLSAARIDRGTTTPDDWRAIATEYDRLTRGAGG